MKCFRVNLNKVFKEFIKIYYIFIRFECRQLLRAAGLSFSFNLQVRANYYFACSLFLYFLPSRAQRKTKKAESNNNNNYTHAEELFGYV